MVKGIKAASYTQVVLTTTEFQRGEQLLATRTVPGHWEGDLLCGSKNSYIVTLVERHSRYVMLAKVTNRETQTVVDALIRQSRKLPDELYRSLTWDRG